MRSRPIVQRKIVIPLTFAAALLSFTGCMKALPPPEPPPYEGVALTVSCPPGLGELVRARSRAWADRQQVKVEAVEEKPDADVRLIATPDLPHWAARGYAAGLPESITAEGRKFEWQRLLPDYRERLLKWNREAFGVPITGESPVCVYRADRYAPADLRAKYRAWQEERNKERNAKRAQEKLPPLPIRELRAPPTWEEFALQAEFFFDQDKRPSLPPLPEDEDGLDRLFFTVAASYARRAVPADEKAGKDHLDETFSFHFDQQTGEPRIAEPGFVEALALLQRLQRCRPAGTAARPEEAFAQGKAVLYLTDASRLIEFQKQPALRDRFGVCQIPGSARYYGASRRWVELSQTSNRVPYLGSGGFVAVVLAASKNQAAAFDLLEEMAGPAGSRQTALEPRWGGPTRTEHLLRDRWDSYDLDVARTTALREVLSRTLLQHNLRNPASCLRTPNRSEFRSALVEGGLRPALLKGEPAEGSMAEVKRRWEALIEKRGKEAHLRDYRLSLGLLGR